jgi:hypothetical protein
MPPRKRAASAPKTDPEQEPLETPAKDAEEEPATEGGPEPDAAPQKAPAVEDEKADAGWKASPAAPDSGSSLCRKHFSDGVTDGVTAVACEHGSWYRDNT